MKNINSDKLKKIIGANIRKSRLERNLSIEELAELLEVSEAFVGLIERGQRGASVKNLVKISELFDISIDSIIFNEKATEKEIKKFNTINFLMSDFTEKEIIFFTEIVRLYRKFKK